MRQPITIATSPRIKVRYSSVDRYTEARSFLTLAGASRYARMWIGDHPELGTRYAISGDGVGKIVCEGATMPQLFPEATVTRPLCTITVTSREHLAAILDGQGFPEA